MAGLAEGLSVGEADGHTGEECIPGTRRVDDGDIDRRTDAEASIDFRIDRALLAHGHDHTGILRRFYLATDDRRQLLR